MGSRKKYLKRNSGKFVFSSGVRKKNGAEDDLADFNRSF